MPNRHHLPLVKIGVWSCVVLLGLLSLLPKQVAIHSDASGWKAHGIAYFGTMLVCALGYRHRIDLTRPALALSAYAALLEVAQHLSPGRTPRFVDFVGGVGGVLIALLLATAPPIRMRRRATVVR